MGWLKKSAFGTMMVTGAVVGAAQFDPEYGFDTVGHGQLQTDWRGWVGLDGVDPADAPEPLIHERLAFDIQDLDPSRPLLAVPVLSLTWDEHSRYQTTTWVIFSEPRWDGDQAYRAAGVLRSYASARGEEGKVQWQGKALLVPCPDHLDGALECYEADGAPTRTYAMAKALAAIYPDADDTYRLEVDLLGVVHMDQASRWILRTEDGEKATLGTVFEGLMLPARVDLDDDGHGDGWRLEARAFGPLIIQGAHAHPKYVPGGAAWFYPYAAGTPRDAAWLFR